jgi:hypothetical protein
LAPRLNPRPSSRIVTRIAWSRSMTSTSAQRALAWLAAFMSASSTMR